MLKLRERINTWLAEPLPIEVKKSIQVLNLRKDIQHIVVLPDVHLSKNVCIGTTFATKEVVYPGAIGGDIGCGISACCISNDASILKKEKEALYVLERLYSLVPSLARKGGHELESALFRDELSSPCLNRKKDKDGIKQFATLGRGNHFIEFQKDENNRLWLMIHSGSRGMGQSILRFHLEKASHKSNGLPYFYRGSSSCEDFLRDHDWALSYAKESRLKMATMVAGMMKELIDVENISDTYFDCTHNFIREEEHDGVILWVHRKGAISARQGEPGIIAGSMGTPSFHVFGRGCKSSLHSCSHGAGRRLSRGLAFSSLSLKQFRREMEGVWFDNQKTKLLLDEAPSAYKDVLKVIRVQKKLMKVNRRVWPLLSYKGA